MEGFTFLGEEFLSLGLGGGGGFGGYIVKCWSYVNFTWYSYNLLNLKHNV